MAAYPVPYNGGYNNGYNNGYGNSPIGPQAYDPRWPGWHPWGYGPGYPPGYGPGGNCCPPGNGNFPPPIFPLPYPAPGSGGCCCMPGFPPCPGCRPPGNPGFPGTNCFPQQPQRPPRQTNFDSLRNIAINIRNVGNGDDRLTMEELEDLRNRALVAGDTKTANMAEELMEHYDELNDKGGGFFGFFENDQGISEDTIFDILASLAQGQTLDSAINEEAQDHD